MPELPEVGQLRCWDKTARKNVYRKKSQAKRQASRFRRARRVGTVRWYRCRWCGLYHLGNVWRGKLAREDMEDD